MVQLHCIVCWSHDEEKRWASLPCGHVLHEECLKYALRGSGCCPICRERASRNDVIKLFFSTEEAEGGVWNEEQVEELANSGTEGLRKCLNRIQNLEYRIKRQETDVTGLREELQKKAEECTCLEEDLALARKMVESTDAKRQKALDEMNCVMKQHVGLKNEVANLRMKLNYEQAAAAKAKIASDPTLMGQKLSQHVKNLAASGTSCPDWFSDLLEKRNKMLMQMHTRLEHAEKERCMAEQQHETKMTLLQQKIHSLEQLVYKSQTASDVHVPSRNVHGNCLDLNKRNSFKRKDRNVHDLSNERSRDAIDLASESLLWENELGGVSAADMTAASLRNPALGDNDLEIIPDSQDEDGSPVSNILHAVESSARTSQEPKENHASSFTESRRKGSSMLIRAGPSKLGMRSAPGPSFIQKQDCASTGLQDGARYIKQGPNGKGGRSTFYHARHVKGDFEAKKGMNGKENIVPRTIKKDVCHKSRDISQFFSRK